MARIPARGATVVSPHRTRAELGKVLEDLCPKAEFTESEISELHLRLWSIVGRWSAEQTRFETLSIARRLTAISKNMAAATDTLSAHQTGVHEIEDIEVVSQLKIVLMADPRVGSLEAADKLISSREDPAKIVEACLIAARNLKKQVGKSGRPRLDWHDDFTELLLRIARKAGIDPQLWKDPMGDNRWLGWLFEASQRLEMFLLPKMRAETGEAAGKRLQRSKKRLAGGMDKTRPEDDRVLSM